MEQRRRGRVSDAMSEISPERFAFEDDGTIPNNQRLRVLLYRGVLKDAKAQDFERRFAENGWSNSWRNGIFRLPSLPFQGA